MARIAAVLWDMDGTLMDSEPYWLEAERELCAEHGGTWDADLAHDLIGHPLLTSAQVLKDRAGIKGTAEEVVDRLVERVTTRIVDGGVPWRPGAAELLHELHATGVPCALVTMSYTALADLLIGSLPQGTFSAVVTGDTVSNGKPHPEPYLRAMAELGVESAQCIAIEDSLPGLTSAQEAGACPVGVPAMVPIPPAPGRVLLESLSGLTVADLERIMTVWQQ